MKTLIESIGVVRGTTTSSRAARIAGASGLVVAAALMLASYARAANGLSGAEALARLKAGNARFASDASSPQSIDRARRVVLAGGQAPFATVLSCADSRVPPEIVFNTGLGDLFVVRAAGEVVDRSVLASVEYAVEHVHTPLLVVMGHEFCGAVKAAIETKTSLGPNLDYLLKAIKPAIDRAADAPEKERLKSAILANVEVSINDALGKSEILRHAAATGVVMVVAGYYELESGRVTFSQPVRPEAIAHVTKETKR